jgi:hypothetical protein
MTTELILSDITEKDNGLCLIGLKVSEPFVASIRPLPPGYPNPRAWTGAFDRGQKIRFQLGENPHGPPHSESRLTVGDFEITGTVAMERIAELLRQSDIAESKQSFFHCEVHRSQNGHDYVLQRQGSRSICGCIPQNLRLVSDGGSWRCRLYLRSNEALDVPLKDRDWIRFLTRVHREAPDRFHQNRCLSQIESRVLTSPCFVLRIGLSQPYLAGCWLMAVTLCPKPDDSWLER